jgi:hypothetical protein
MGPRGGRREERGERRGQERRRHTTVVPDGPRRLALA